MNLLKIYELHVMFTKIFLIIPLIRIVIQYLENTISHAVSTCHLCNIYMYVRSCI